MIDNFHSVSLSTARMSTVYLFIQWQQLELYKFQGEGISMEVEARKKGYVSFFSYYQKVNSLFIYDLYIFATLEKVDMPTKKANVNICGQIVAFYINRILHVNTLYFLTIFSQNLPQTKDIDSHFLGLLEVALNTNIRT